jgi:hypothetical protein
MPGIWSMAFAGPEKKGPHAGLDGESSGLRRKPRRIQPVLGTRGGEGRRNKEAAKTFLGQASTCTCNIVFNLDAKATKVALRTPAVIPTEYLRDWCKSVRVFLSPCHRRHFAKVPADAKGV